MVIWWWSWKKIPGSSRYFVIIYSSGQLDLTLSTGTPVVRPLAYNDRMALPETRCVPAIQKVWKPSIIFTILDYMYVYIIYIYILCICIYIYMYIMYTNILYIYIFYNHPKWNRWSGSWRQTACPACADTNSAGQPKVSKKISAASGLSVANDKRGHNKKLVCKTRHFCGDVAITMRIWTTVTTVTLNKKQNIGNMWKSSNFWPILGC